jgi:hypothetical protein
VPPGSNFLELQPGHRSQVALHGQPGNGLAGDQPAIVKVGVYMVDLGEWEQMNAAYRAG